MVLIFFSGIRLFMANQERSELKEATISYLSQNGYDTEKDLENIDVVNVGKDEIQYSAVVTFKDEIKVDYFYIYKKGIEEIMQFDTINKGTSEPLKHKEG